ncbi:non-ribosomal peptide synthetase [Streptomyces paludis]|uniref:Non-ribosomal peptide synthetase n=1 Tax=Streptomyces paludis TaxID=2282738 RepID=A0A345HR92_9ACTN|nr:non-ribosomal peptide synthetase [Streptomyces paludis]AXG79216.1 non-ribosomal peptide synthetase [Streptomyces paludis]
MTASQDPTSANNPTRTLPLTAAQRGLWFAQQLDPANPAYNIAEYADVRGDLDTMLLGRAVRHVSEESEALRVTFGEHDGVPFQEIHPDIRIDVPLVDLSGHPEPLREAQRLMEADLARPADIATGPLVRLTLYRLAEAHHLFHQQVHHLALDGYGAALALARIAEVYTHLATAPDEPVERRAAPLGPVIDEENAYRSSDKYAEDGRYWADHFDGAPAPTSLHDGSTTVAGPGHGFLAVRRELDTARSERLRAAAKTAGVAWPTFFMAAMGVYLHRSRGLGDVILGLPVTGRRTAVARTTPTMLSNVLPLRLEISSSDTVADIAKRASAEARRVLKHQRYPSEGLLRDRRQDGSTATGSGGAPIGAREPLTGPSVNVLAFDDRLRFGPHTATLHNLSVGPVDDLVIAVHASYADGGLRIDLLGNPGLYTARELEQHHDALWRLVEAFADDPTGQLGALPIVPEDERRRVIGLGSGEPAAEPREGSRTGTLPEQFAEQARRTPHDTAVVCAETRLTFAELDARVSALAAELGGCGAGPGTRVAVGLPRSTDLVVAMLAVMRCGAAYLPLDPSYPADRVAFMLADSRPVALVATTGTAAATDPGRTLPLVDPAAPVAEPAGRPVHTAMPGPKDAAYVIYTSGSTGRPKGVVVEHRSLANLLEHHRGEAHAHAEQSLGRRLRVALTAATSFDASWDPVLWMVAGHELHIVDDETRRDPQALVDFLVERRIDAIETTPTYLRQMMAAGLLSAPAHRPRVIALGGEAVDDGLWNELASHHDLVVFNFYGPTETTVNAVTSRIAGDSPVIGRPVAGARAYVLDTALHPLPVGAAGELYVSGEGVARGYAGRPGLTAERFLPDPFGPPGLRMYRTGDLARWSESGALEFLGRGDSQVKIRGYRVETGEIESALRSLSGVRDAAVVLRPSPDGTERLAAYLVTGPDRDDEAVDTNAFDQYDASGLHAVRDALVELLPEHMVPTAYAVLPRLPLTPNGKLDTGLLPAATPLAARGGAPRTPEEESMCAVFAECLEVPAVGRDDNFFLLGGHSLLATRLVSRVRDRFGSEVPIRALFDHPTPAGLVTALDTSAPVRPPVAAVEPRPARLPLSFAQQRLWLLDRMGQAGTAYHLPIALRLYGRLDRAALAEALGDVIGRHESLRTVFGEDEDGPHQRVLPVEQAGVPLVTRPFPAGGDPVRPDDSDFPLGSEPPLRAELFTGYPGSDTADEHLLVLTLHHIAADGWSMGPLLRDLSDAYEARRHLKAPNWTPLPVQYADYTLWQRDLLGDPRQAGTLAEGQLAHWSAVLDGLPPEVTFPADRPRPARHSGRGGAVPVRIDAVTHRALARLAGESGTSTFMVLHAALAALMTRLGAGEDISVGTPVAGRPDDALADMVGFFVNTLVLRTDTSGDPDFHELLRRVRAADLAAYAHQDLPFERLVEELRPSRSSSRHPLFQVMLSLNNAPGARGSLADLTLRHDTSIGRSGAKFDLTWDLAELKDAEGEPSGLTGELEFAEDLFDRRTAERFVTHFGALLSTLVERPDQPVTDSVFLSGEERRAAVDELPRATAEPSTSSGMLLNSPAHGPDWTITDILTSRATADPGRTAVVDGADSLTFGELLAHSERLARTLSEAGVERGDRVAVALPRTARYIAALLGVLRAGAVHVPLDPAHPRARNQLILDTADPRLVLTTRATRDALPGTTHPRLELDEQASPEDPAGLLPEPPRAQDAAYVLYTSGSTGRPKGVVVEHRSLSNLLASHRERLMGPAEAANNGRPLRVALTAATTFDASWDPLLWMVAGHELHLVDDATRRDPEALTAFLHHRSVDVVETTPSFFEQLRACGLFAQGRPRPRVLALGGEAVNDTLWDELGALRDVAVWNLYGPTEVTVDSVMGRISAGTRPHIGRPVAHTRARVLDARLQPVAPGATGELYLAGAGLARGYENASGATAARFLPDPYGAPGARMYRTGDLVRRREGRLEFVGRADGQTKVRGFRVETGEVEAALLRHSDVVQAAVAVRTDVAGAGRLVAWVVPCDGQRPAARALRAFVAERLPEYMVPSSIVPVPGLPLTVHGKVDFDALPHTAAEGERDGIDRPDSGAPRSAQEEILCALFAECLEREEVSRDDDFFELGGHSLLAVHVIGRIRGAFGVELSVRTLFEATTPAALAERLDDAGAARPALRRASRPARPPLSPAQRRLWFLHCMGSDDADSDAAYHIPIAVRLTGHLDRDALRAALGDVVARHESLRTLIRENEGEPFQAVLDPGDARPEMPVTPLAQAVGTAHDGTDEDMLNGALRASAARRFDLSAGIPLRAELFELAADRHVLLLTVHHIAADGWSMGPLAQDLAGAYAARAGGRTPNWAPLPVQYADYTLWQRALLGADDEADSLSARQLAYWAGQMRGAPEETALPVDRARPQRSTGRGGTVGVGLSVGTARAVAALARQSATSTFMVLHAALAALLSRIGAGDDVTIGTPVAGRTDEGLDGLVGFFVNTLPLRVGFDSSAGFRELLAEVRETDLAAYAHQELPFERLVEEVRPSRSLSRHPLFQVMLTLNNTRTPQLDLPGLHATMDGVETGGAKFDLSFSFTERPGSDDGERLDGTLEYARDLFDESTALRIADWFRHLVDAAVAEPTTPVRDLPLYGSAQEASLIGDTEVPPAVEHTVLDRFARTVARSRSGDIAVNAPDGRLSFPELAARSDRVARLLTSAGVAPGDVVAVLLPRSTDSIASLLGVLKAGAVYAPIDPGLPAARVEAILDDARPRLVLTAPSTGDLIPPGSPRLILGADEGAGEPVDVAESGVPGGGTGRRTPGPDDAAYLIHTSGSTGRPKGVLVAHRSLARLLEHHRRDLFAPAVRRTGRSRLTAALTAALSFDASWDPVLWMIDGHELHLSDDLTRRDPEGLVTAVRAHRLDVLETTPSHARQLLDAGLLDGDHRPAVLILGGEAVPPALWAELRAVPGLDARNFYGPTEATVDTLTAQLVHSERPVLGTPVSGTRIRILDDGLRPVPTGVTGDLHLAGDSLALGYLGRSGETAARFLPDPYGPPGTRMYRTGDRVRRSADGGMEFAGRTDGQIKVRGFRVETGEIAAALRAHPDVAQAVVVPGPDGADDGADIRLVAHLVPADADEKATLDLAAVRAHAARHLPAYMVPSAWTILRTIPLTANGKLDHAALPVPVTAPRTDGTARGPRNPREDILCTLFAEALGVEQVLIDDDFFMLGGHSLLATRLIARIRATLGVEVSIRALFEAPTVAALAERLREGNGNATEGSSLTTLLPLRTTGARPPLFCVHPAGGLAWSYAGLLPHLDSDQPMYGLQTPNLDGTAPFPDSMEEMAAVYVAELRRVQPHGPYHLLGWSFGGNLVQEVAVQLQEAGERVALLAILDAFPLAPLDDLDSAGRDTVFRALLSNLGVDAAALDGAAAVDAASVREEFRRIGSPLGALEPVTIDAMVDNFAGQARLMRVYTPRVFQGPALFFTATEGRPRDTFGLGLWAPYITGHIENHDVACAHAQMMQPAAREQIGATVAAALRATHHTTPGEAS